MDSYYRLAKADFNKFLSALTDIRSDASHYADGTALYNYDFNLLYPFFWWPNRFKNRRLDSFNLNTFEAFCANQGAVGPKYIITRSTVLEMLQSILRKIEDSRKSRGTTSSIEELRTRFNRLVSNSDLPDYEEMMNGDMADTFHNSTQTGKFADLVNELSYFYSALPGRENFGNIDKVISLLRSKTLHTFSDYYSESEIGGLRPEINRLSGEISSRFQDRPEMGQDRFSRSLNRAVDSRNIASSIVLNNRGGKAVSFVGADYPIDHKEYFHVRRNQFVPMFWLHCIITCGDYSAACDMAEAIQAEAKHCKKNIDKYNNIDDLPQYASGLIGRFYTSYIEPMNSKMFSNMSPMDLRNYLAGKLGTEREIRDALEAAEADYAKKAKAIIESLDYNGGFLDDSELENNPRAQQILREFNIK